MKNQLLHVIVGSDLIYFFSNIPLSNVKVGFENVFIIYKNQLLHVIVAASVSLFFIQYPTITCEREIRIYFILFYNPVLHVKVASVYLFLLISQNFFSISFFIHYFDLKKAFLVGKLLFNGR